MCRMIRAPRAGSRYEGTGSSGGPAEQIRGCTRCELYKGRTNAVPGEGPVQAEIMFIGEGPGAREDKLGRPFVGASGRFLDELLEQAGLSRDEVWINNVV